MGGSNTFIEMDNAAEALLDAVVNGKTVKGMEHVLAQYKGLRIKANTAEKLYALVKDIASMPTEYFEAKPQRAVGLDEVKSVILPNNKYPELENKLVKLGIPVGTYNPDIDGSRVRALNSGIIAKYFFSRKDGAPATAKDVQQLQRRNESLKKQLAIAKLYCQSFVIRVYNCMQPS